MSYDEGFFLTRVGPVLTSDWQEAHRTIGDDSAWVVWPARIQADIDGGLSPELSLAKHRAEWRAALGLPNFPPGTPRSRRPLPPFDPNVLGGDVHTTLPPEQLIPVGPSIDWWRGDAWGVTLNDTPPFVPGANTTPREMVMSYLLPYYNQEWREKILLAHQERGYTHFHLDRFTWDRAGLSLAQVVELFRQIQSHGFYTSYWATSSSDVRGGGWSQVQPLIEPVLQALIQEGLAAKTICFVGEELDNGGVPGPSLDGIIDHTCRLCNPHALPVYLHFSANKPSWQGSGSPIDWWMGWNGRVRGIGWQANDRDSAGLQSAHMWDTRKYLAQAGDFRVVAFELVGNSQLFGRIDEDHGNLRGWEAICATRGREAPNAPPVAGFGNGARYPSGAVI